MTDWGIIMGQLVRLGAEHFEAVYELYRYAFHKEPRGGKTALAYFYKQTDSFGEFEGDHLTSQITQIPFQINWIKQELPANGIGNVGSYPEFRGNGAASRIMMETLQKGYDRGDVLSYLAPFSYGFYERFGYAHVFDHLQISWLAQDFPQGRRAAGEMRRLDFETSQPLMAAVYDQAPEFQIGSVVREKWWWQYYFAMKKPQTQYAVYLDEYGEPQGYVAYEFDNMIFKIREWVTLTNNALLMTTRFIGSHAGAFETFVYESPISQVQAIPVLQLMTEPKYKAEIIPYMQARIVNLAAFVATLNLQQTEPVVFNVADESAPWNGGRFELQQGRLQRIAQSQAPAISGNIQAFTQWLMGYRTLESLLITNDLQTDNPVVFQQLAQYLPNQSPILADYF